MALITSDHQTSFVHRELHQCSAFCLLRSINKAIRIAATSRN
jgi:hypothetical protein